VRRKKEKKGGQSLKLREKRQGTKKPSRRVEKTRGTKGGKVPVETEKPMYRRTPVDKNKPACHSHQEGKDSSVKREASQQRKREKDVSKKSKLT